MPSAEDGVVLRARKRYNVRVPASAIVLDHIEKSFPKSSAGIRAFLEPFAAPAVCALTRISLSIDEGESVAILGTNGAGKSTLLRILATLLIPTQGSASVAGYDVRRRPREARRNLGYHAGSDLGFYSRLSGRDNLLFFGRLNHLGRAETNRRISELSDRFDLSESIEREVRTLSSGTIHRLSLVRALLHQPSVLLLDEPTRSLDAIAAADFRHFLKREVLKKGKTTLLFASHSLAELELLADRIAVLDRGKLIAFDSARNLKSRTQAASLEEMFQSLTGRKPISLESSPA